MERVLRVATAVLLFAFIVFFIAAKVHFFMRFGATDLGGLTLIGGSMQQMAFTPSTHGALRASNEAGSRRTMD